MGNKHGHGHGGKDHGDEEHPNAQSGDKDKTKEKAKDSKKSKNTAAILNAKLGKSKNNDNGQANQSTAAAGAKSPKSLQEALTAPANIQTASSSSSAAGLQSPSSPQSPAPPPLPVGHQHVIAPEQAASEGVDPALLKLSAPMTRREESALPGQEANFYGDVYGKQRLTMDDFDLLKVIGKGSFGKVMQVRKKDTGKIYAMKVLKKQQLIQRKQVAHTKTERKVLEEIDHPFIVHLRYAFQSDAKLYMVLDYYTGGELFFHLKNNGRFHEDRAKFYAAEIVSALTCLHNQKIVYRDLKPENVLLDEEGHVKLTDFGLSKEGVSAIDLTHTFCGTPEYLAPEVIQGQGYGTPIDWWSLGTLLFEMLTGMPPFYNQNLHVMYEKILRAKLIFPSYLSGSARSLLSALLERNPQRRLGTQGGGDEVKRHEFFAGMDWDALEKCKVKPPFIPANVDGKLDVTNIDEEFKRETPKDTPAIASTFQQKVNFPGFTFAAPESNLAAQPTVLGKLNDDDD